MPVLLIETSHEPSQIGLWSDHAAIKEVTLAGSRDRGRSLISEIQNLFQSTVTSFEECHGIAVSIGPGSFTGVRVGVVCAKTLAYAWNCPVTGVSTMRILAENAPATATRITCLIDALRDELFVQTFERNEAGVWAEATPILIQHIDQFHNSLAQQDRLFLTGPPLSKYAERLAAVGDVLPEEGWSPQLSALGQLAASTTSPQSHWELQPLYVRRSAAEEKWDLRQSPSD